MIHSEVRNILNEYGSKRIPFIAILDFEGRESEIHTISDLPPHIHYDFSGKTSTAGNECAIISSSPISLLQYQESFKNVSEHLHRGDTYLVNLTAPTEISLNCNLDAIYNSISAKYKVLVENRFLFFSPETFVTIENNHIRSHPMKGTINAEIPNARETILSDPKETAEHNTIVDLIRNDLSIVATNVHVPRFRYIDEIETHRGTLLQVSSEVKGTLEQNWQNRIGDIFAALLPAGSISGAPKKKTVEIINESEIDGRGFYTGVTILFDGESLDSCVNIRYIEQRDNRYFYRSGGGITAQSDVESEYNELLEKIYVPSC